MATKTSRSSNTIMVAAIDFGTTYSGYAFSFRDRPMDLQSPQTWYAGSTQLASMKTPTCILIRAGEKTLFGYEAENTYADLTTNDKYDNLSRSIRVDDINGKSMQALKVFSLSIEYFKNHLLETIKTRSAGVNLEEIHFVLTVPAIWNDSAKQFMREAAVEKSREVYRKSHPADGYALYTIRPMVTSYIRVLQHPAEENHHGQIQAGLDNDKLTIALEPEAASIYCQNIPTDKFKSSCRFEVAKAGTEYMVVDLGGGTVDITVQRKEVDGSLSSLHAATGGPWGGQMVNQEYINFYREIVGQEVMQKFQLEEMGDYFDLLRDFETKKRTILPGKDGNLIIRIPASLKEIYEKPKKCFAEAVQRSRYSQFIELKRDKLQVSQHFIEQMFKRSINETINHVSTLLDEPKMRNVDRILLVGGYSECPLILEAFRNRFGEKRIINPHQAGLAVINGAVHFGHNPAVISSRILSYTYGISTSPVFKEGIHPENLKCIDKEGTCRCDNVFSVFKHKGNSIKFGEKVSQQFLPKTKLDTRVEIKVHSSTDPDPKYTKDCEMLGKLTINLPPYTGKKRDITVDFVFGLSEFMVKTTDETTGKEIRKYFSLSE